MRLGNRNPIGIVWIALGMAPLCFAVENAERVSLQPRFSDQSSVQLKLNDSYLSDFGVGGLSPSWKDRVFEPKVASELKLKYQDATREYEMKKKHRLVTQEDQRTQIERMESLGRDILLHVQKTELKETAENLEEATEDQVVLRTAAALGYVLYVGKPVNLKLDDEFSLIARARVPKQEGSLSWYTPIVDGSVDFRGRVAPTSGAEPLTLFPNERPERYKVSLSRTLPVWDITSGLSYGGTTTSVTASLSKKLSDRLTCTVDSSRATAVTEGPNGQETVKFLYGVQF